MARSKKLASRVVNNVLKIRVSFSPTFHNRVSMNLLKPRCGFPFGLGIRESPFKRSNRWKYDKNHVNIFDTPLFLDTLMM